MQDAYFRFPDAHADTEGTISRMHKNCTKCKAREMQHCGEKLEKCNTVEKSWRNATLWRKVSEMQHCGEKLVKCNTAQTWLVRKIYAAENFAVHCTGSIAPSPSDLAS